MNPKLYQAAKGLVDYVQHADKTAERYEHMVRLHEDRIWEALERGIQDRIDEAVEDAVEEAIYAYAAGEDI